MIPSGTKFVGINPDFPTAERKSAQNNAAQEVYTIEDILESATLQQVSDAGGLNNGSTIRQGSINRFGLNGIEIVCSEDKRIQFADGVEYYYPSSGGDIVHANSMNGDTPDSSYDETQGFKVGSFFNSLALGITYVCTDQTEGSATWLPMGGEYTPTLSDFQGAVTNAGVGKAFYSINNGICEVTINGTIEVDFSLNETGRFIFTVPIGVSSQCFGVASLDASNQLNGIVLGSYCRFSSKDTSLVSSGISYVAKFSYQVF